MAMLAAGMALADPTTGHAHRGWVHSSGEVVFSIWPLCDYLVVRSSVGYSLVHWGDGLWVFVGDDTIYGRVNTKGRQTLIAEGTVTFGKMDVTIEETDLGEDEARRTLEGKCRFDPAPSS
jgi:hypothetical protein